MTSPKYDETNVEPADKKHVVEWAEEGQRRVLHRYVVGAATGYLILIMAIALLFSQAKDQRDDLRDQTQRAVDTAVTLKDIRAALDLTCSRVNIVRAQSNLSNSVSFDILSGVIRQPGIDPQVAATYRREVDKLNVTPLTNCTRAVDTFPRSTYKFPRAIRIGDPTTGVIAKRSQAIIDDSLRAVRQTRASGG